MMYTENLVECLKTRQGLEELARQGLEENRSQFLAEFLPLLGKAQGQTRLALMGSLVADAGVDLLPIFKSVIQKEANLLFGKSLILMLGHFTSPETVNLLKELMPNLHPDLKTAANRVISKINSQFRDQFYLDEFVEGLKNPKRLRNAIEHMVAEPSPLYVPFLNKMLSHENTAYREPALEVLSKLGDASSIEPLAELLGLLAAEGERTDRLCAFLLSPKTRAIQSLTVFLESIASMANWEPELTQSLKEEVLRKKVDTVNAWVRFSFGPFGPLLSDPLQKYLDGILLSGEIAKVPAEAVVHAFKLASDSRLEAIRNLARLLGRLGRAFNVPGLEALVSERVPHQAASRSTVLVCFGAAYRSKSSLKNLLDSLASEKDPARLLELVTALIPFDLEEQPPRLMDLVQSADPKLRRQALALFAKNRPSEQQLHALFHHANPAIVADILSRVAEDTLEVGYPFLLSMLDANTDSGLFQTAMDALVAFPRGQTGTAMVPWTHPSHPYAVRQAALSVLIRAGGPHRIGLLSKVLEQYPEDKRDETLGSVLSLLHSLGNHQPSDLLSSPGFWQNLLCHRIGRFRDQALLLLERADWQKSLDEGWLAVFDALATFPLVRPDLEKRRLAALSKKVRERLLEGGRARDIDMRFREELVGLMDQVETASHFEKVAALRKINVIYKEEVIEPRDRLRLIYQIGKYFGESEGDVQGLKLAIAISAKLGDEHLLTELQRFVEHEDPELARFARKAYHVALRSSGASWEVRSILVVDSALMAGALHKALTQVGYKVEKRSQPGEALEELKAHAYDLLMISYRLGDVSGAALLREARHQRIEPQRVMILTSSRDPAEIRDMEQAGASLILHKPFPMEELFLRIKELGYGGEGDGETILDL